LASFPVSMNNQEDTSLHWPAVDAQFSSRWLAGLDNEKPWRLRLRCQTRKKACGLLAVAQPKPVIGGCPAVSSGRGYPWASQHRSSKTSMTAFGKVRHLSDVRDEGAILHVGYGCISWSTSASQAAKGLTSLIALAPLRYMRRHFCVPRIPLK